MSIGDLIMDNDLTHRPWEIATTAVTALFKELSPNTEQIAPALPHVIKVEIDKVIKVQTVETPAPGAEAQSRLPLTEDQVRALMGEEAAKLPDDQKQIRRYAVLKYGAQWRDIDPADVQAGARDDDLYKKEVGVLHHITTFRRALGRKLDRRK